MIEPGPLHETLARFTGVWSGAGGVSPSSWSAGGPTTGEWRFSRDIGGLSFIHDYQERRHDGSHFELHGVFTVDPAAEAILWFAFDSYGYPPVAPSRGAWEENRLVLTKTTPRGVGRSVFELDGDWLIHSASVRLDGAAVFERVSHGRFQRHGD